MLASVSLWLAEQGNTVSVIGRRPERMAKLQERAGANRHLMHPITVNYRDSQALRQSIEETIEASGPIELAVFWIHSDAPEAFSVLADAISSHSTSQWELFHVRGSAAHLHPESPQVPDTCAYHSVILGFVVNGDDSRWLTNAEISGGVMEAIVHSRDCSRFVVGTLEPWDKRPM